MQRWNDEGSDSLWLITEEELNRLPDGIILECIDGKSYVKGADDIDLDSRFGHLAYGVRRPYEHAEKDLFLMFALSR